MTWGYHMNFEGGSEINETCRPFGYFFASRLFDTPRPFHHILVKTRWVHHQKDEPTDQSTFWMRPASPACYLLHKHVHKVIYCVDLLNSMFIPQEIDIFSCSNCATGHVNLHSDRSLSLYMHLTGKERKRARVGFRVASETLARRE